jgi:hypothetical protein
VRAGQNLPGPLTAPETCESKVHAPGGEGSDGTVLCGDVFISGGGPAGGRAITRGGSNPSPSALISPVNAKLPLFTKRRENEFSEIKALRKVDLC